ncbi:MAG: FG-GAP repeat protein, partial [Chloroflexi bacterium]|nr:FG-GAP repeat protein [Chloroflexota bacterium]
MRSSIIVPFLVRGAIVALLVMIAGGLLSGPAGLGPEPQSAEAALLSEVKKLLASDAQAGDLFGWSVAVSGDTAVVGAWLEDDGGSDAGAAYV